MSRSNSESFSPSDRANRENSSLTMSGTLHLSSDVALPNSGGKPVERANKVPSVEESVFCMLGRAKQMAVAEYRVAVAEYLARINELSEPL